MRLNEFEGKELFRNYGIAVPRSELLLPGAVHLSLPYPVLLKSQVPIGNRKAQGGVISVSSEDDFARTLQILFERPLGGSLPSAVLAEEILVPQSEWYISFSYSGQWQGPVMALSALGGSGITAAYHMPIDVLEGLSEKHIQKAAEQAGIEYTSALLHMIKALWDLFTKEKLQLAEINPIFYMPDGQVIAADAKIIRDDALLPLRERSILPLSGDIAVIASGGGASMLAIDLLLRAGGKPANYLEYSGNPEASVVEDLTYRALSEKGLRGAWVIGGTANFTDIYETMKGFMAGLQRITPPPRYPIVIRRDGPRLEEAKEFLLQAAREGGFDITIEGPEISMADSASFLCQRMKTT